MSKHTVHNPDYTKDKTADVVKKGSGPAVPQDHWQVNKDLTPSGKPDGWGAFLPMRAKDRPTPHTKTNECDH
jgi:hypothetical protein